MPDNPELSLVIPLYNEEENIPILFEKIEEVLKSMSKSYELIFVDDGSRDNSFEVVKKISTSNLYVKGISLSRNFGHHVALLAGMQHARGYYGC